MIQQFPKKKINHINYFDLIVKNKTKTKKQKQNT